MNKAVRIVVLGALLSLPTTGVAIAQDATGGLRACTEGRCEGTEGRDVIVASNEAEEVIAKGGDDDIELDLFFLSGSNDVAFGGPGRDCIDGGGGDDLMIGGPGDDNRPCVFTFFVNPRAALTGGPGNDRIEGGPGADSLDGIFDDDTLLGGEGNDVIDDPAPFDRDKLFGGPGNDLLNARDGDGDDVVDGGPGRDNCSGDAGDLFTNCEVGDTRISPSGDTARPEVGVSGVPSRNCARRAFSIGVTVSDTGGIASVGVRRDEQVLSTQQVSDTADASFAVRVPVAGLRVGRHRLAVTANDEAGNSHTTLRTFRRCAARTSRSTG
jgi:Ca2+-binding RTX toxin-like protein